MVADVFAYQAFPRFHILAPLADNIYQRLSGNDWEATVYLGLVNIAVLACLCLPARHKELSADDLCSVWNGGVLHFRQW